MNLLKIKSVWLITGVVVIIVVIFIIVFLNYSQKKAVKKQIMSYHTNIIEETKTNENFRHVLFTGNNSQLVIMSIPPGGEVGAEVHKYTEQTLFFLSGTGEGELDGAKFPIGPGDVVVVVPGTEHNFTNTGTGDLKIYTVYAPPNHIDGLVEATKADADANVADEAIGENPPIK